MPILFAVIAFAFAGIAAAAAVAGRWPIAAATAVLAAWMGSFAAQAVRRRRR